MRNILFAVCFVLSLCAVAEPVDSLLASRGCDMEETEEIVNLWTWPQEMACLEYKGKTSVWTPDASKWYASMSNQGYISSDPGNPRGNWFEEDSFHVQFRSWYLMGRYLYLEPGAYVLTFDYCCETYVNNVNVELLLYQESGNGFVYSRKLTLNPTRLDRGEYKSAICTFVVPADINLVGFWIGPTSDDDARDDADIWNVWLEKIGE